MTVICVRDWKDWPYLASHFELGGTYVISRRLLENTSQSFRPVPSGAPCY